MRISLLRNRRFVYGLVFSLIWSAAMICGACLATKARFDSVSLMRALADSRMSIVLPGVVAILPLVLSAVALRLSCAYLFLPIAGLEAFAFGFAGTLIFNLFGNAGWLMRWLLLFTDSVFVILQLWYWFRCIFKPSSNHSVFSFCVLSGVVLISLDAFVVSPFAAMLLNHLL